MMFSYALLCGVSAAAITAALGPAPPPSFDDYPTTTHWRLVFTASTQNYIQLQEANPIGEDGNRIITDVTLTASSTYSSAYQAINLINRGSQVWCSAASAGTRGGDHVTFVFTEPQKIIGFEIWYDQDIYRPDDVVIQYSDDEGVTWHPLGQMGDGLARGKNARFRVFSDAYREYVADQPNAHKFWRFLGHMQDGAEYVQIQEIVPYDTLGVARYDHDMIVAASSNYNAGNWYQTNAFNMVVAAGQGWCSNGSETASRQAHIQVEYAEPVELVAVGIVPHSQYGYTLTPLEWDVLWSDDGENWTLQKQVIRGTAWTEEVETTYPLIE